MDYDPITDVRALLAGANRPISLRLSNGREVLDDVLLVKRVRGTESICGGVQYTLSCVATRAGIPLKALHSKPYSCCRVSHTASIG